MLVSIPGVDEHVIKRAERINLLLMDVDGVMTNGGLSYVPGPDGQLVEVKQFNSQDNLGLYFCHKLGITTGLISGRTSAGTSERARLSNMHYVYQGHVDKLPCWDEILNDADLKAEQVAYIGDDFLDIPLIQRAGLGIATANARPQVKEQAHYTTQSAGGEGAVREVVELLLKARGLWQIIIDQYIGNSAVPSISPH